MPDRLYDDPDELAIWARAALAAAGRGEVGKRRAKTRRRRSSRAT
jgi:DNA transformation protein